ncbi:hypothetical protein SUGI_1115160 [Cryptomeria japonica]|nr:hypothetical protein SUGI_1115160 [Cryptomeria japonica]
MITGAYSSSGTLTVTNIKSYISFYTHRKNNTNKNTKYIRVCATPPFSIPSEKNKKKKQVNRFWQIVKKDSEFVQKGIHWTREVGLPVLAKRIEGIFLLRNWEDPDAKLLPPLPWSKPHYPELTGTDLLAADVKSLKEYIDYLRGSLDMWRIPLQESYDPDQIAAYFNCRPHVLASRILEVSVAFASVIIKEKSEKALKLTRSFSNRKTNEIQSEYFTGEILKETMLKLGPTFVKVGQSISTRPDLVGQAIGKVLAELQDRLPPFPTAEARQIIEEELGCKVDEVFSSLSKDPVAAASFGQVYRGCTIEGEDVAVKVQRPNALYNVARDIYILRLLFGFLGKLARRKSDLRLYIDELGQALYGELDYRCEATNASEFQELHAKLPFVSVPKAFHHLTRKRVLTMEWMTGDNPKELLYISTGSSPSGCIYSEQQRLEARNRLLSLVNRGVEASLVQLLETGLLHADPHPGNLVYTSTGQIGFLDFGLLCRMEEKHQYAMLASIVHIVNADWPSLVIDLADMDIIRPETDLRLIQMELQDALGDAAANDGTSMPDIKFSKVLGKIWAIALKYHFKMPPYYTLVLRSVASLEGLALAVDPDFKTFQAAYPYVVHRLLTNNSIRMRKILHSLVLNERKEFQWPKVALFLKLGEQQFKKRDALKTGGEAHVVSNPSKNPPGGSVDLANTIMKLLSSADGAVLRRLLVTADTPSLAKTFVSVDATEFRRNVVENFAEILSEWGTRILREEHIYLRQTAINHDQTDRMESSNASSLDVYKNLLRDHRLKVVLFTALKRLTRSPLLMLRVCWTCAMILCSALALASHRLLVELCHIYVQPVPVVRKRKLAYQTVA